MTPEFLATVRVAKSNLDMVIEMMLIREQSQDFRLAVILGAQCTVEKFLLLNFLWSHTPLFGQIL